MGIFYVDELKHHLAICAISNLFRGIYAALAVTAGYMLLGQQLRRSLVRSILFALNTIMFTGQIAIFAAAFILDFEFLNSLGQTTHKSPTASARCQVVIIICSRINYFLGETVVLWRAWIFFKNRPFRALLFLCGLGSLIAVLLNAIMVSKDIFYSGHNNQAAAVQKRSRIVFMPAVLLITNLISTLAISWKVWQSRRAIKTELKTQTWKKNLWRALLLLLESGLVSCICWVVAINSLSLNSLSFAGRDVLAAVFPDLTVIYPTLIIILVTAQKSYNVLSINVPRLAGQIEADIIYMKPLPSAVARKRTSLQYGEFLRP
ncbi:hypothetical protein GYMLUDRAFT_255330 [Collybiopsis luxurians FD-317 M1]|nr:hypothetical protein GYMLUDRAFT_255330 [Collybiopsis luxurians FD-317 M1]